MVRRLLKKLTRRTRPAAVPARHFGGNGKRPCVRVMTYNIHHGRGLDHRYDLARIAEVIRAQDPDIVALQEIEQFRIRTRRENQPAFLAKELGMHYTFARVRELHNEDRHLHAAYGNAILSKHPIVAHEHFNISFVGAREPRGCLHATVEIEGRMLHVFCVHLGLRYRERHFQVERLLSEDIVNNSRFGNGPKVLMGDFNNWWPVKSAQKVNVHFHNACLATGQKRLRTFGRYFNYLCLDYVYTSRDLNIVSCEVLKSPLAKIASDHRPVACTLEIACEPTRDEQSMPAPEHGSHVKSA